MSAHLAAGMRLQRSAHVALEDAGAVFTPGGRLLALAKRAENARDLLRHAATEMDRARSRRGPILHYVAMGHANKLIAYELGLPQGTVATRIAAIMRKLGVRSRVEIVDRYLALTEMNFARVGDSKLYAGSAPRGLAVGDAR